MPSKLPRVRRIGTFTAGVTLMVMGAVMVASLLCPQFPMEWVLKFSPLMLVILGAEILYCRRDAEKETVRYDWAAILLCVFVVCTALALYGVATVMAWVPALIHP